MGDLLSTPKTEKVSEGSENSRLRYGLSSMQGWRKTMEDAHAAFCNLDDSTSFFGVYDGHGGKDVSRYCAEFLHQKLLEDEAYAAGDVGTSVKNAFLRMDEMIFEKTRLDDLELLGEKFENLLAQRSKSVYRGPTCGSTACVAIIQNNQLIVANVGDSRCVISQKGKAHDLSKDHKPDLADERNRIVEAGGIVEYGRINGSLNLSRALGDIELKQNKSLPAERQIVTADPDVVTVELSEDDEFLIIACDGIWECMTSQQAVDFVKEQLATENTLSAVCGRVLDECLAPEGGEKGCDNMTMILVQFKKPSDPKPSSSRHQPEPSEHQPEPEPSEHQPEPEPSAHQPEPSAHQPEPEPSAHQAAPEPPAQ